VVNVVFCGPDSGLDRGFEVYDHQSSDATNVGTRDARLTTDRALEAARTAAGRPLLLVVHYFDPHLTYDPPAPFDTLFEPELATAIAPGFGSAAEARKLSDGLLALDERQRRGLVARYDGEIRFVDTELGRLRHGLEALGRWEGALVIVVADHGEEFWDHGGFEHGHSHHRELLRVPLVLRRPRGAAGRVREERVRQIDIAPTVLAFAGIPATDLPGRGLAEQRAEYAVAEGSLWGGDLASIRSDRGALFLDRSSGGWRMFAPGDVLEATELLSGSLPESAPEVELLRALPASRTLEPGEWNPDALQFERLRSLGYIR
jgi:arylsulfatase A-like enzyme